MSLVRCPECGKMKVSQYAEECPDCGFPILKFLEDHNLNDFSKVWICTKCGETIYDTILPNDIKCRYCGNIMKQTNINIDDYKEYIRELEKDKTVPEQDEIHLQENERLAKEYGDDFSKEALEQRVIERDRFIRQNTKSYTPPTPSSQVKCPTCGSTNVKKISVASKAVGAGLFGLFSKTAKSQFECSSCGYKW